MDLARVHRPSFQPGDVVRLRAGGDRVFTVLALEDYGNIVVCEWQAHEGSLAVARRERHAAAGLVKLTEDERKSLAQGAEGTGERPEEGRAEQAEAPPAGGEGEGDRPAASSTGSWYRPGD